MFPSSPKIVCELIKASCRFWIIPTRRGEIHNTVMFIVVTCWVPQEDSDLRFRMRMSCLGINTCSKKETEMRMGRSPTAASADSLGDLGMETDPFDVTEWDYHDHLYPGIHQLLAWGSRRAMGTGRPRLPAGLDSWKSAEDSTSHGRGNQSFLENGSHYSVLVDIFWVCPLLDSNLHLISKLFMTQKLLLGKCTMCIPQLF